MTPDKPEYNDDAAAVQQHLSELKKECSRKKITDQYKVVRLLSLTHAARQNEMSTSTAATRIYDAIEKYVILQTPSYVSNLKSRSLCVK